MAAFAFTPNFSFHTTFTDIDVHATTHYLMSMGRWNNGMMLSSRPRTNVTLDEAGEACLDVLSSEGRWFPSISAEVDVNTTTGVVWRLTHTNPGSIRDP